ncbi:histidine kinase of a two-component regulator system (plasmid) [Leptospira borgpetersenii serovar Ballum]|uniref:Histidine kinase of a two-component regulator system n=1 Tax=Leptospira borgpetersenii serovar Ballum TaxID=280505 RepID=A0A0S2IYA5_LEPBO|nr:histidine kinase of a two-component regulator system [Leptospira borgpetersenii serovar Ballum]
MVGSESGLIRVNFTRKNEMLTLEISDSGKGLPEKSIRNRSPNSLGLSLDGSNCSS